MSFLEGNSPFDISDVCVADIMDAAPRQQTICERQNPLLYFNDLYFKRRYRLRKATVSELAMQYGASEYCSTMCSDVRAGITAGPTFTNGSKYRSIRFT